MNLETRNPNSLPGLDRRTGRLAGQAQQNALVAVARTEAAALVTHVGLQGTGMIAAQLIEMHERHGDVILPMAEPIVRGYSSYVSGLIQGLG